LALKPASQADTHPPIVPEPEADPEAIADTLAA